MRAGSDRGSAAAEFAVAMPAVLLVFAMLLAGLQVAGLQLRAVDAAADAARSWARGETYATVVARLARQVPGARVVRSARGDLVCATVSVSPTGPAARLGIEAAGFGCAVSAGR